LGGNNMAIETPKYDVLQKEGNFEIRQYKGYITASVEVKSNYRDAWNSGFRILADYIFGKNKSKTYIAMTAPVTEQDITNEKIDMTAPVTSTVVDRDKKYIISFSMPAKYTMENLPEPMNKQIKLQKVKPYKAAALTFRGYMNEKSATNKEADLRSWMRRNNLSTRSTLILAQYNPPWILGPFRRNEIIAKLD
jgi:hypothetical protein